MWNIPLTASVTSEGSFASVKTGMSSSGAGRADLRLCSGIYIFAKERRSVSEAGYLPALVAFQGANRPDTLTIKAGTRSSQKSIPWNMAMLHEVI